MLNQQPSDAAMMANPPLLPTTNKRKNEEYHELFEGDESELVEDFSCALQKDILVHGRMYISHSCWTSSVLIKFTDLVKVEKRNSAFVLPNALMLYTTEHKKYFFASFVFRDLAYNILVSMWRNAVSGILVGNGMSYLEDQSDFSLGLSSTNSAEFDNDSDLDTLASSSSNRLRAHSETDLLSPHANTATTSSNPDLTKRRSLGRPVNNAELPTLTPNGPVKETCPSDNVVFETIYSPCTVSYLWHLLYSDESYAPSGFTFEFHNNAKQCFDWSTTKWSTTSDSDKPSRHVEYIMPLNNPLGPKQVQTFVDEIVDTKDLTQHFHMTHTTATPDVPSGSSFTVVANICCTAYGPESVKLKFSSSVVWTKSSFIKGPIESNVLGGVKNHWAMLDEAIIEKINGKPKKSKKKTKKVAKKEKFRKQSPFSFLEIVQPIATGFYEYINLSRMIIILLLGFNLLLFYQILKTPGPPKDRASLVVIEEDVKAIKDMLQKVIIKNRES